MSTSRRSPHPRQLGYAAVLMSLFALGATGCGGSEGSSTDPDAVGRGIQLSAHGCSFSGEPENNAVEYAAGMVALIASLVSLRRRFRRDPDAPAPAELPHRPRLPSMP